MTPWEPGLLYFHPRNATVVRKYNIVILGSQSIKIDIVKPLDRSISIDKLNLTVLDVIDQSIKLDSDTLARFHWLACEKAYVACS